MAEGKAVIIKRVKKYGAAHHGGAWKVAYADFVTAMMAFFLLLWLLNAVTEEQLTGIADYFAPTTVSKSASGAGGMLGGQTVGQGAMSSQGTTPSFALALPPPTIGSGGDALTDPREGGEEGNGPGNGGEAPGTGGSAAGPKFDKDKAQDKSTGGRDKAESLSEQQILQAEQAREEQQFQKAQAALKQAINSIPELKKLADSLMVDNTPEGLRIQIVDQEGLAMFPSGSPDMFGHTKALIDMVARVVKQLPEKVSIAGYTDSTPFAGQSGYGNWELSADRALATRRALLQSGVPADRVDRVVGKADTDPLDTKNPADPRNRRITIVLLRDAPAGASVDLSPNQLKNGALPESLQPQPH
ncbi:MAG TPA: flagellar motor protein MotB [Magnetospirillaceae bacterium]|nr:flagellar motor protein MotB [Magnetospirillaceae bacterium]